MAKIKNEDYLRDAELILTELKSFSDLNISSKSFISTIETYLVEEDGFYAFTLATRAKTMHEYDLKNR